MIRTTWGLCVLTAGVTLAFLGRATDVQRDHRDTFASQDVYPLVPAEVSGVFANLSRVPKESAWTLYNAIGRSVHQPVLHVTHISGATYSDAWKGKPTLPALQNGWARIASDLGAEGMGCVVQKTP